VIRAKRDGYALIAAVVAVALAGVAILVLSSGSNGLLIEADRAHAEACGRNLAASALAWARDNAAKLPPAGQAGPVRLDAEALDIPGAAVDIVPLEPDGSLLRVRIDVQCRRGRINLKRSTTYVLAPREQGR